MNNHKTLLFGCNIVPVLLSITLIQRQERQHGVDADLPSLWAALATMTACAWVVTVGGDLVSTRALLLIGGILPPVLGSISAAALLSLCGIKLVHFVHLAAVLVLGERLFCVCVCGG